MPALQFVDDLQALNGIVEQLLSCHYECEAGPLELNVDFMRLREIARRWPPQRQQENETHAPAIRDVKVHLGPKLFSFSSFADWVNQAQNIWKRHNVNGESTVCLDQKGRICGWGKHFMTARDESTYPIDVYLLRVDMLEAQQGVEPINTIKWESI